MQYGRADRSRVTTITIYLWRNLYEIRQAAIWRKGEGLSKFLGSIVKIVHTGYKGIFKGFLIDGTRASVTIEYTCDAG